MSKIYTLGKGFFAAAAVKGLSIKVYSILWSALVFFAFLEKRRPIVYWLWRKILVFQRQIFSLTCYSVNCFKSSTLEC